MRVLTIRQPWAWAIIHGGKTVENRTRNLAGSYRGPVAIHAGRSEDVGAYRHADTTHNALWSAFQGAGRIAMGLPAWRQWSGHIIGVVDFVDVHAALDCMTQDHEGDWKVCTEWSDRAGYHLVLANPRALDQPVPWRGGLGLRRSPLSVHGDAIVEQVDGCTCGTGPLAHQHEPLCGVEIVAHLKAVA